MKKFPTLSQFIPFLFGIGFALTVSGCNYGPYLAPADNVISFSHDGQQLLVLDKEQTIAKVLDANKGDEITTFPFMDKINALAWSVDDTQITVTYSTQDPIVWDVKTGEKLFALTDTNSKGSSQVQYSKSGNRIATKTTKGTFLLWEAQTGKKIAELALIETGAVTNTPLDHAQFSPVEDVILVESYSAGKTFVWNAVTGDKLFLSSLPASASFSPDGTLIYTGVLSRQAWDAHTGTRVPSLDFPIQQNERIIFSASKYAIVPVENQMLSQKVADIFDSKTRKLVATIADEDHYDGDIFLSPDGRFVITVTASDSGYHHQKVKLWNANTGKQLATLIEVIIDNQPAIALSAIGYPVFSSDDTKMALYKTGAGFGVWDLSGL